MDSKIPLELLKARAKLERLINQDAPYEKIYKQSKKVDKYIVIQMKIINNKYQKEVS